MARLSYPMILRTVLALFLFLSLWGCGDLVQEDAATSGCEGALNDRKYDTALTKCTGRRDRAAAYMGKAGYDIINLLEASSGKAITDSAVQALLGTENVGFSYTISALKLGTDIYPDETARETAMRDSKTALENVVDLYDEVTPTGDELILKTFGAMFAVSLEAVLLLDVGIGTTHTITDSNFSTNLTASAGKILITSDSSIPESSIAASTIVDSTNSFTVDVGNYIEKYDGRIWSTEQNQALMIDSIELGPLTQFALGTSSSTLNLYGNLGAVCRSFGDTKTSSDPPGRGILDLISEFTEAVGQFSAALAGASSDAASEVTSLDLTDISTSISAACDQKDQLTTLP